MSDLFVQKLVSIRSTGVEILRGDMRNPHEQNNLGIILLKLQQEIRTAGRTHTNKQTVTLYWS